MGARPVTDERARAMALLLEGERYPREDLPRLRQLASDSGRPELEELYEWLERWWGDGVEMTLETSGSTGTPKRIQVRKGQMIASAEMTCRTLDLKPGGVALLCMSLRYVGAQMMVVRSMLWGLDLIVRPASAHPLEGVAGRIHFASMVPLQVASTLEREVEAMRLGSVDVLLIGGGRVDASLEAKILQAQGEGRCYSTYGMTETLSHIALRQMGGGDRYYPLQGVTLSLSERGTLVIDAPHLLDAPIETNDFAELMPDGGFRLLGRADHVINSGGVKIHPEQVEALLSARIGLPLLLTSTPDARLGEALVLLLEALDSAQEGGERGGASPLSLATLRDRGAFADLPSYHAPRYVLTVERLPRLEGGKLDRLTARSLAQHLLSDQPTATS